jgi:hypothetical protein
MTFDVLHDLDTKIHSFSLESNIDKLNKKKPAKLCHSYIWVDGCIFFTVFPHFSRGLLRPCFLVNYFLLLFFF